MNHQSLSPLFILGLLLLPNLTYGLPDDRDKPIQLEADRAQLDQRTGVSVYEGNVVITQGSMRLAADSVTITMKDGAFEHLEAVGKPAAFRYKPDVNKEEIQGTSQQVDYNVNAALVVMTSNAKIIQGQDVFTGDRIEYDLNKDLVRARGAAGNGERVQITIHPRPADAPRD